MTVHERAPEGITAEDLIDALNGTEGTSDHPWIVGHVLVCGERLWIDRAASDALAARILCVSEEQGRAHNENHSDFMVAGGLAAQHTDGIGWDTPCEPCPNCGAETYADGTHVLDKYDRQSNGYKDCTDL